MRELQGQIKTLEQKIGVLQVPVGEARRGTRRPEVETLMADGRGDQPAATPDVGAYQNATTRVDQFLEKAAAE